MGGNISSVKIFGPKTDAASGNYEGSYRLIVKNNGYSEQILRSIAINSHIMAWKDFFESPGRPLVSPDRILKTRWHALDPFTKVSFKQHLARSLVSDRVLQSIFKGYVVKRDVDAQQRKIFYIAYKLLLPDGTSLFSLPEQYDSLVEKLWNDFVLVTSKSP